MKKILLAMGAVALAMTANAEVIWEGTMDLGKWSGNVEIEAEKFATAAAGNFVSVTFTVNEGVNSGQITMKSKADNWPTLADNAAGWSNVDSYNCFQPGTTDTSIELTAEWADALKANGGVICGENLTVTKVELLGEVVANPNIFEGEGDLSTWSKNVQIMASKFANAKAGDAMQLYFTVSGEYGQIKFCNSAWEGIEALAQSYSGEKGTEASVIIVHEGDSPAKVTIDAATLETLKAGGLILSGENVMLSKIVLGEGGDTPGEDPVTPPASDTEYVWTGTNSWNSSWTGSPEAGIQIPAAKLGFLKADDVIVVDYTCDGAEYCQLVIQDGEWADATATQATANNNQEGQATCFAAGTTQTIFNVAAADVETFKTKGMVVKGADITITRVQVGGKAPQDGIANITATDNSLFPVEYFNLQGQRINEPAAGQVVIRRQGTEVVKFIAR